MSEADEKELTRRARKRPGYVHASDPNARDTFLAGSILFDVTMDGRRFTEFFKTNPDLEPFALTTEDLWWGSVRLVEDHRKRILITAHRSAWVTRCQELCDARLLPPDSN